MTSTFRPIKGSASSWGDTEPGVQRLNEESREEITNLLMGRKVGNGWPKDWQKRMLGSFCPRCGKGGVVVGLDGVLRETRPKVRPHACGVGGPGSEIECQHHWLDRPESDTRECLICGTEVAG